MFTIDEKNASTEFTYSLPRAQDPDYDTVTTTLLTDLSAIKFISFDKELRIFTFSNMTESSQGSYNIQIKLSDPEGGFSIFDLKIRVQYVNNKAIKNIVPVEFITPEEKEKE